MRIVIATAVGLLLACSLSLHGQEAQDSQAQDPLVKLDPSQEPRRVSVWMKQKLGYSQKVFAGLTSGDMAQVRQSAQAMRLVNKLESFVRRRHPAYRAQLRVFQLANDEIIKGAEEQNLERATLGYTQLTVSCISCHRHLRGTSGDN